MDRKHKRLRPHHFFQINKWRENKKKERDIWKIRNISSRFRKTSAKKNSVENLGGWSLIKFIYLRGWFYRMDRNRLKAILSEEEERGLVLGRKKMFIWSILVGMSGRFVIFWI
jgi:hypothetical protein